MTRSLGLFLVLVASALLPGCDNKSPAPPGKTSETAPTTAKGPDHHGDVIDLGTGTAGPFTVQVSRDDSKLAAGGEAPIDVVVTSGPKATAVRFWIGIESAKGSIRARGQIEDAAHPNHWHAHAEVPDPLPAGSKLWVEIEGEGGAKGTASFDLKM
jgi:hypothetical protein